MCQRCNDVGLVEEVDGAPAKRVRITLCPESCQRAWEIEPYVSEDDMAWRDLDRSDPFYRRAAAGTSNRFQSLLRVYRPRELAAGSHFAPSVDVRPPSQKCAPRPFSFPFYTISPR
ncbi:hypothetical protein JSE7799_00129 [Jannaschia seosinensis]|uniref:Uncharacterized protein n=1 Tax=Jannaschia seosinensis TaxID=313367 RepID=A0A0M7B3T8_9RHOB|nr:hypothetical protein JSE7799_00129 [Jannaschia seosinensis]